MIEERWKKPHYTRGFLWSDNELAGTPSASSTIFAQPLPSPPKSKLNNQIALKTIKENPSLFKIVTPINITRFEELQSHPNQPYVSSVCQGFREGFWPHAVIPSEMPESVDFSLRPQSEEAMTFICEQQDKEIALDCFSPAFGPDFLPGMLSSPIGAVPKSQSAGLQLITDQSASPFAPNSFLPRDAASV
ncbi:hypothetical protein M422DRAFT_179367 [Sphaerobolus stellatus SS14]|uniref:Uncharacterized protein n=1 Tax=Sphaerobolus stellatus (strain SS14) TaxID=990650 RepID=A0A0C9U119_SPHS4|nr:hypothetical protein M422DRAFT_179367 [Sphaerobolus stellatus SS14]